DSFLFQGLLEFLRHVRIFVGNHTLGTLNDRHPTAEPAKHLAKFEANVTAPQDQQVFRHFVHLHDAGVGQVINPLQPLQAWNVRPGAGVDEDALAFQGLVAHADAVRVDEAGVVAVQVQILPFLDLALLTGAPLLDDVVLARPDLRPVHANFSGAHPPLARMARVVGHLGGRNQGLGRRATRVDTGAAEVFLFDQGHGPAAVRQLERKRVAGLAGTNDDRIVPGHRCSSWFANRLESPARTDTRPAYSTPNGRPGSCQDAPCRARICVDDRSRRKTASGMARNKSRQAAGMSRSARPRNLPEASTRPATRKRQPWMRTSLIALALPS